MCNKISIYSTKHVEHNYKNNMLDSKRQIIVVDESWKERKSCSFPKNIFSNVIPSF